MAYVAAVLIVLGGIGIGAHLVIAGHPWIGTLVIVLTACVKVAASTGDTP